METVPIISSNICSVTYKENSLLLQPSCTNGSSKRLSHFSTLQEAPSCSEKVQWQSPLEVARFSFPSPFMNGRETGASRSTFIGQCEKVPLVQGVLNSISGVVTGFCEPALLHCCEVSEHAQYVASSWESLQPESYLHSCSGNQFVLESAEIVSSYFYPPQGFVLPGVPVMT